MKGKGAFSDGGMGIGMRGIGVGFFYFQGKTL